MTLVAVQRKMIGHAALILLVAFAGGVGLLISLLGGVELVPGHVIPMAIAGESATWARAHVGGLLNALLIIAVAAILPVLGFSAGSAARLGRMLIGTGWANTLFYWAALYAANRALSFGPNRFGEGNWASVIGLAPALLFVFVAIAASVMIARQAFGAGAK
jgi:hypothetical protein